MATLEDLPRLLGEDPQVREDFLSMFTDFCQRHGIETAPADFVGLSQEAETTGFAAPTTPAIPISPEGVDIFIYRDGPKTTRWFFHAALY